MVGSRFAFIGPVVIVPGSRLCSAVKMTQRHFLVIPHVPGSPVSSVGAAPPFEGSVSSYSTILTLGISSMPRACAFFLYPSYFSVYIFSSNLYPEAKFTHSPHTLPKRILQSILHPLARSVLKIFSEGSGCSKDKIQNS